MNFLLFVASVSISISVGICRFPCLVQIQTSDFMEKIITFPNRSIGKYW